jgi:hypothetical protein
VQDQEGWLKNNQINQSKEAWLDHPPITFGLNSVHTVPKRKIIFSKDQVDELGFKKKITNKSIIKIKDSNKKQKLALPHIERCLVIDKLKL